MELMMRERFLREEREMRESFWTQPAYIAGLLIEQHHIDTVLVEERIQREQYEHSRVRKKPNFRKMVINDACCQICNTNLSMDMIDIVCHGHKALGDKLACLRQQVKPKLQPAKPRRVTHIKLYNDKIMHDEHGVRYPSKKTLSKKEPDKFIPINFPYFMLENGYSVDEAYRYGNRLMELKTNVKKDVEKFKLIELITLI